MAGFPFCLGRPTGPFNGEDCMAMEKDFEYIGGMIPKELKDRVIQFTIKKPAYNSSDAIMIGLARLVGATQEDQDRWMRLKKGGKEA